MKSKFKGIKTASEYRRGELSRDILRLIGAGVIVGTAIVAPNVLQVVDMFDPKGRAQRNRIWKAIKYLEECERITFVERDGERIVLLTKNGKVALDALSIDELSLQPSRMWDRKWRMVMFDIPMYKARARVPFREKLRDLGFEMYQKSVFVYPYECREEILAVAEYFDVREHVSYMLVEDMTHMREYVLKFDLL